MHEIDRHAALSVWRGTAFAGPAIAAAMSAMAFDAALAVRLGAILSLFLAIVLHVEALLCHWKPVQQTEVWILLDTDLRPPRGMAARMIQTAMRTELNIVARIVAAVALGLFGLSLLIWLVR